MFGKWFGVWILVVTASLGLAACGADGNGCNQDASTGADTDSDSDSDSDSDTDADTDTSAFGCPDPIAETCPDGVSDVLPPLLFEAADFGEGTRFIDVSPWTVLAERDADGVRTISVIMCATAGETCTAANARIATMDLPSDSGLHAVAVAMSYYQPWDDAEAPSNMAALCGDTGCALYSADLAGESPSTEITAIPGGEIPGATIVHGLWWGGYGEPICAYGDGIHCFDGTAWTSPITASTEDPLFNDMETFPNDVTAIVVAVGDSGRLAFSGFPDWPSYWGDDSDWLTVQPLFDGGFAVAGEDGAFGVMDGAWHMECDIADEDIVLLEGATIGVTASGRVFTADGPITSISGACYTGEVIGPNARGTGFECGMATNLFVMDEATVYGTTDCWID
ncbi:MAG: hypothetical protein M0R80_10445 [Proteobacteria bacterium]|jgi:hypothetical protein|nr:hypothetical protein [Pseudomonadota bacterium]